MRYKSSDIAVAFRECGLGVGDSVFVSSSLGLLGPPQDVDDLDSMCAAFHRAIREVIGPGGTIFVPTYSYTIGGSSFSEPTTFDPNETPAQIGPFPNYFRKVPGVYRSLDPMMSIAGEGPQINVLKNLAPTSYGRDSVFSRLLDVQGMKCLNIGVGVNFTPFIHYADWLSQAPHRYDKLFSGYVAGFPGKIVWHYPVRILRPEGEPNCYRLGNGALEKGIWRQVKLGRGTISVAGYRAYFDYAMRCLALDPWALAEGPPADPLQLEAERHPALPEFAVSGSCWDLLPDLSTATMPVAGPAAERVANLLRTIIPCAQDRFRSGDNVGDWIVPEYCYPVTVNLKDSKGMAVAGVAAIPDSLSIDKDVIGSELAEHISSWEMPPRFIAYRGERDWGLVVSDWCPKLDDIYHVTIDCVRGLGEMTVSQVLIPGAGDGAEFVVFVDLEKRPGNRDSSWQMLAMAELANMLLQKTMEIRPIRFVFAPGAPGFAAWYHRLRDDAVSVAAFLLPQAVSSASSGNFSEDGIVGFKVLSENDPQNLLFVSGRNPLAEINIYDFSAVRWSISPEMGVAGMLASLVDYVEGR